MATTRDRILDAADEVIDRLGLAHATTKQIARAAGYSEATLYKHFQDKEDLFVHVLLRRMPAFIQLVEGLPGRVGTETVTANLLAFARGALEYYEQVFPLAAGLFAEPQLLEAQRAEVRRHQAGPHLANAAVADYLRAEQRIGRVADGVDVDSAAAFLVGACFQHAFLHSFAGQVGDTARLDSLADGFARTLAAAVSPAKHGLTFRGS